MSIIKKLRPFVILLVVIMLTALCTTLCFVRYVHLVNESCEWVLIEKNGESRKVMDIPSSKLAEDIWELKSNNDFTGILQLQGKHDCILAQYEVVNGIKNGFGKLWDNEGKLIMEATYLSNQLHGAYITWHDNGVKASEGVFYNNVESGRHRTWHKNGKIKSDGHYINGLINGNYREWMPDGVLLADAVYSNMWIQSGTAILERTEQQAPIIGVYSNGNLVEKRVWKY